MNSDLLIRCGSLRHLKDLVEVDFCLLWFRISSLRYRVAAKSRVMSAIAFWKALSPTSGTIGIGTRSRVTMAVTVIIERITGSEIPVSSMTAVISPSARTGVKSTFTTGGEGPTLRVHVIHGRDCRRWWPTIIWLAIFVIVTMAVV